MGRRRSPGLGPEDPGLSVGLCPMELTSFPLEAKLAPLPLSSQTDKAWI